MLLTSDTPEEHSRISPVEKLYIRQCLQKTAHKEEPGKVSRSVLFMKTHVLFPVNLNSIQKNWDNAMSSNNVTYMYLFDNL